MNEHTPRGPSPSGRHAAEPSPDELEQRQRPDGSYEPTGPGEGLDGPLDPDELEQRQRLDGTVADTGPIDEPTDDLLDPDQIDQRRLVTDDDYDDEGPADR